MNQAVEECISEDIMSDFLKAHRGEVLDVCITEYNEEKVMDALRREYQEEGIENALRIVVAFGIDINVAVERIAQEYHMDSQKVWQIWEKMNK